MIRAVVLASCCIVFLAHDVRAEDKAKARELYRDGTQHYKLGEYPEALKAFKEAYRNFESPSFLFNIGQCHRQLNNKQDAIRAFRNYLNDVPNAPNREEVRQLIAALDSALKEEAAAQAKPPTGMIAPPPTEPAPPRHTAEAAQAEATPTPTLTARPSAAPTPIYKKWWLWTAVGAVVAVGVGVGLGIGLSSSAPQTAQTNYGTFKPF